MISKEDIEHLKDLSRVEFGEKETEKLAKDLGAILEHIGSMKEVDISNAPEMSRASEDVRNIYRNDSSAESAHSAAELDDKYDTAGEIINAFPEKYDSPAGERHGTYLKVKSIL